MSEAAPTVSVCIPTRDRAHWLGEALDSVLRQTLADLEVIVSDDASTDDTAEVVARRGDARVKYLRHPRRIGVAANRNACLGAARGRYVAWLDSDDAYHPGMLETQVQVLEEHRDVALAHGAFDVVGRDGRRLPDWPRTFSRDVVEPGRRAFRELILQNEIGSPTVVVRREVHEKVGGYATWLESGEDWEMWLRIALHGDVAYTSEPLARYRWHRGSLARSAEENGAQLARELRIVEDVVQRHRRRIPCPDLVEAEGRTAVAARAILQATERVIRRDGAGALADLLLALEARRDLRGHPATRRLARSVVRGDEYGWHVGSRALLGDLAGDLGERRFSARLRRRITPAPGWEAVLERIAAAVREATPAGARIAVVDKWDPTVLHLSGRRGWHFPDRRRMPGGYPEDSRAAVLHLEELRERGARYLVLPCSSFWWLEHYGGLRRHLEASAEPVVEDENCVIYRLTGAEASCAA